MTFVNNNHHLLSVLPEEVVQEILLRLPVKSILRFKCVSKSWYSFLNNPSFIAKHLSIQSEDRLFITTFSEQQTKRRAAYSVSSIDDEYTYAHLDMLSPYMNCVVDDHHRWQNHRWQIKGPCDGLIAIADYSEEGDVVLCNIATRNFRTLPKSFFYPFPKNYYDDFIRAPVYAEIGYVGIGYDGKINDYKVLRILEIWSDAYQEVWLPPKAEVFSIGTDTCWREIDMTNLTCLNTPYYYWYKSGACADGTLFGMMCDNSIMLTFNIVDERFQCLPMPERRCAQICDLFVPAVYNMKMAVFYIHDTLEGDSLMDVWVMNKCRMEECWTKLLTFRRQSINLTMSFFKNNTEFVYVDTNGQLWVYDLVKMETKMISLKDDDMCLSVIPYMQTLVCINNRK